MLWQNGSKEVEALKCRLLFKKLKVPAKMGEKADLEGNARPKEFWVRYERFGPV